MIATATLASDALTPTCLATADKSVPNWMFRYWERSAVAAAADITPHTNSDVRVDSEAIKTMLRIGHQLCISPSE